MRAKEREPSREGKFFSWLRRSAGGRIFRKYLRQYKPRPKNYIGRIMVPVAEKTAKDNDTSLIFPPVFIKEDDAWKMFYLASSRLSEVSSLMRVEWSSDKIVLSSQIFPRQFCSTVKSDIDSKWVADYSRNLPTVEERGSFNCNFWMHSHMSRNMARWSGYDGGSINKMVKGKKFLISLVVVAEDGVLRYRCRIDWGEPFPLTVDDIPVLVVRSHKIDHDAIKKEMDREYGEKVIVTEDHSSLFLYDREDGFIFSDDPDLFSGDGIDLKGR